MIQQIDNLIVSIVISAYNEEKYLPGLIEDLKRQTYNKENIEILKKSKLGNEELIQELTLESVIFKWILEEVDKI